MDNPWEGLTAVKRVQLKQRIAVLDQFLSLLKPTPEERATAIETLGISRAAFYNLIAVWRKHRDPRLLRTAHRTRPPGNRKTGVPLNPIAEGMMELAIRKTGADKSTSAIFDAYVELCRQADVASASEETLRRRHREVAKWLTPPGTGAMITVDHCALNLAVEIGARKVLPVVTAAFLEPEGIILSHTIDYIAPVASNAARALWEAIDGEGQAREINLHLFETPAWGIMGQAIVAAGLPQPMRRTARLPAYDFRRIVGHSFAGIRLAPRRTMDPDVTRIDGYVAVDAMLHGEIIREAVLAHNEERGLLRPSDRPKVGVGPFTGRLREALGWIMDMPHDLLYADVALPVIAKAADTEHR